MNYVRFITDYIERTRTGRNDRSSHLTGGVIVLRSVIAGIIGIVTATGSAPGQEVVKDSWLVPANRGCESVKVGWTVPSDSLGVLPYRSTTRQVQHRGSARVIVSLQAFTCPQAIVDDEPSGSFTLASIRIPIFPNPEAPDALLPDYHASVDRWIYVDTYIVPEESPVRTLLERHGFDPWEANVEMDVRRSRTDTLDVRVTIESDAGRIQLNAGTRAEPGHSDRLHSVLITEHAVTADSTSRVVHGEGQATMTVDGATPLKGLSPPAAPFEFVTVTTRHRFRRILKSRSP